MEESEDSLSKSPEACYKSSSTGSLKSIASTLQMDYLDNSISTPPSELRKQVYRLRDEVFESHEFHDMELRLLHEELDNQGIKRPAEELEVVNLRRSLSDAEKVILDANRQMSKLKSLNMELNERLDEEARRYATVKEEMETELSRLNLELKRKIYDIDNLKKDKGDNCFELELLAEKQEKKIKELEMTLALERHSAPTDTKSSSSIIEELQNNIINLTQSNYDFTLMNKSLQECLKESEVKVKQLEMICISLTDDKDALIKKEKELLDVNKGLLIDVNNAASEEEFNSWQRHIQELHSKITTLEEEKLKINTQIEDGFMSLTTSDKDRQIEQQTQEIKKGEIENKRLLQMLVTEAKKLFDLQTEADTEIESLKSEKEALNETLREKDCQLNRLQIENSEQYELLQSFKSRMDELLAQLEDTKKPYEAEAEKLRTELKEWKEMLNALREKYDAVVHQKHQHEIEISLLTTENDSLKNALREKDAEISKFESDFATLKDEKNLLNNLLHEKADELTTVQNNFENQMAVFKNEYEDKMADIDFNNTLTENDGATSDDTDDYNSCQAESIHSTNVSCKDDDFFAVDNPSQTLGNSEYNFCKMENITITENLNEISAHVCESETTVCSQDFVKPEGVEEEMEVNETPSLLYFVQTLLSHGILTQEEIEQCTGIYQLLVEKYFWWMKLYESCKTEFEEYKIIQEKEIYNLNNRTFQYLDTLRSQIEESDSSVSFNSTLEFTNHIKSSTMLCEPSEIETTIMNDVTLATRDPLSITLQTSIQTPSKTPFKTPSRIPSKTPLRTRVLSAKKLLNTPAPAKNLEIESEVAKLKEAIKNKEKEMVDRSYKIIDLKENVAEKMKIVSKLEERLIKLEDLSSLFQQENESLRSTYEKKVSNLMEALTMRSEEMRELKQRLVLETSSLEPTMNESFGEMLTIDILDVFMQTIMKRCEMVQRQKTDDAVEWEKERNSTRNEMEELNRRLCELEGEELENKKLISSQKLLLSDVEGKTKHLQDEIARLQTSVAEKEEILSRLEQFRGVHENMKVENECLKGKISELNQQIADFIAQRQEDDVIISTKNEEIRLLYVQLSELETRAETVVSLNAEIVQLKSEIEKKEEGLARIAESEGVYESILSENKDLKVKISQSEDAIAATKIQIGELNKQIEDLQCQRLDDENQIMSKNDEILVLYSQLSDSEAKSNSVEELKCEITHLKEEINEKETILSRLQQTEGFYDKIKSENEELKSKIYECESMIANLGSDIESTREDLSRKEQDVQELMRQIDLLQEQLSGVNLNQNEAKLSEIRDLTSKLELAEENMKLNDKVVADLNSQIEELTNNCFEVESSLSAAVSKNIEMEKMIADLESQIQENDAVKEQIVSEVNGLLGKLMNAEESLKLYIVQNKETEGALKQAQQQLSISEDTVCKLSSRIEVLNSDCDKMQIMNSALSDAENHNKKLKDEVENLKIAVHASNESHDSKVLEIQELTRKLKQIEKDLKTEMFRGDELQLKFKLSQETVSNLNGRIEELRYDNDKIPALNSALSLAEDKNKELERVICQLEAKMLSEIESLNTKLAQAEEEVKVQSCGKETLEKVVSDLENKIRNHDEIQKVLATKLRSTEDGSQADSRKCKDLEQMVAELQAQINEREENKKVLTEKLQKAENNLNWNLVRSEDVLKCQQKLLLAEKSIASLNACIEKLKGDNERIPILDSELLLAENKKKELQNMVLDLEKKLLDNENVHSAKNSEVELLTCELRTAEQNLESTVAESNARIHELTVKHVELTKCLSAAIKEKEDLEAIVSNLHKEIDAMRADQIAKTSEINRLYFQVSEAQDRLRLSEEMSQKLNLQVSELIQDKKAKMQECLERDKSILDLRNKLQKVDDSRENLTDKLLSVQKRLKLPIDVVNENIDAFVTEIENFEKLREKLMTEAQALKNAKGEAQQKHDLLERTCHAQLKELNDLKTKYSGLETELSKKNRKSDWSQRRLDNLEELNRLLSETIQEVVRIAQVPHHESLNFFSIRHFESSSQKIIQHFTQLMAENAKGDESLLCSGCDRNVQKILVSNGASGHKITGRIKELIAVEGQKSAGLIESLQREKSRLYEDNNSLNQEIKSLKNENNVMLSKLNEVEKKIETQQSEIIKLISQISSLESRRVSLSSEEKNKTGRKAELSARRVEKLEELTQSLVDLVTKLGDVTRVPNIERMNFFSVRNLPHNSKDVLDHVKALVESRTKEMEKLKTQNEELDAECEEYSNTIKSLKKEAAGLWKEGEITKEKLEQEVSRREEIEKEKKELENKVTVLETEIARFKNGPGPQQCNQCSDLVKELGELKRRVFSREQKLLELQDIEAQNSSYRYQLRSLENALDGAKKKINDEKEKSKKIQEELKMIPNKVTKKIPDEKDVMEQLRLIGPLGNEVQEGADKDEVRKLKQDKAFLKDLCRARFKEIKRLELENNVLKNNNIAKNSNQMNSPIRSKCYNTRSRNSATNPLSLSPWRFHKTDDKENQK